MIVTPSHLECEIFLVSAGDRVGQRFQLPIAPTSSEMCLCTESHGIRVLTKNKKLIKQSRNLENPEAQPMVHFLFLFAAARVICNGNGEVFLNFWWPKTVRLRKRSGHSRVYVSEMQQDVVRAPQDFHFRPNLSSEQVVESRTRSP